MNKKKGITIYLYENEDINKYFEFKKLVRKDREYFNISNFFRLKIIDYVENRRGWTYEKNKVWVWYLW